MSVYQEAYHLPEFTYEYEGLNVDVKNDGAIHVVAFNDAKNLNAMSYAQMADFNNYLEKVKYDPKCRVIVLTGEGKSFCAGFNLNDLNLDVPEADGMGRAQRDYYIMQAICSDQVVKMRACPQPIIGALKGHAIGGGLSLSCACDLRVLGESYKMQAGYLNIGLTGTDMSGSFYLPRIIGYARAAEVLTTARRIGAAELLEWGFANRVVEDEKVVEVALELAEAMCANSAPMGLRLTKESLQSSLDNCFDAQVKMENRNQVLASQTGDARRGVLKMNPKLREDVKAHPENYTFNNL
jgi:enoyl-CoA hydratase/carnithine racemase